MGVWPVPVPSWFWPWARWRLGRDEFRGHPRDPKRRPRSAPARIPYWAWVKLAIMQGRPVPKPPPQPRPPAVDPQLVKARQILGFCRQFDAGYLYGGEHDASFDDDTPHALFDCSSSTSYVLWKFGLLGASRAQVSSWFETWGQAGRGKYLTVHANADHVWTEFSLPEGWWRFDTSPHGDGPRGPRVRGSRRFDSTFVHRHPQGM